MKDRRSDQARQYRRWYRTARWKKLRKIFLRRHPLCVFCKQQGRIRKSTTVDHTVPHKGSAELFWNEGNWQALCSTCHSGVKQSEETTGRVKGCDVSGMPADPGHPWNRKI